ncbi:MAG: anion permease, partial [Victivallales bacterium]|nr:anion permease [Victivallales bacterium]
MIGIFQYLGSAFLGWSLGANDSANVFGTAVSSRMISYRRAVILSAVFIILGALLQGRAGIITLSEDLKVTRQATASENLGEPGKRMLKAAVVASFAAALAVTVMTILKIPVSTSQAVVGAIIGVGLIQHNVNMQGLGKVVVCWLGTPVGGVLFTFIFYFVGRAVLKIWRPSVFALDPVLRTLLIVFGCYGAYALGANNVANVSAMFVGENMLSVHQAAVFGSLAIASGALTFSSPVMKTVGKSIVELDAFSGLVCVS